MISSFTALSSRGSLGRRRSSRASISWLTSDAAVVHATVNPFWQAAQAERDMGLAGATVAQREDVLAAQDILAAGEFEDEHLVEAGGSR